MGFNTSQQPKTQRPIPPVGAHPAICYSIVDLGTHMKAFPGQDPKPTPLMQIGWEFATLDKHVFSEEKGPQPLAIFNEYTVSLGDKAKLFKVLQSWRGQDPVDLEKELPLFLGQPCLINVVHNADKQNSNIKYANISGNGTGIMRLPQGMNAGMLTNEKIYFNLDNYSHETFLKLPEWIQKKIKTSLEWTGIVVKFGEPQPVQAQPQNTVQQNVQQPVQQTFNNQPVSNDPAPF